MSAFLGPIHYWLYNKVTLQENLIDEIIYFAEKNKYSSNLSEILTEQFGKPENLPLEEIIDGGNIHGWLQGKIAISEHRLALSVTTLLNQDKNIFDQLKSIFFNWGQKHAVESDATVEDAFKLLNDTLIDGMPCDWVNEVVSESENEVVWKRTMDVHGKYWNDVEGNVNDYYSLRQELIKGIFSDSHIDFQSVGDFTYSLTRR
ncbi:MAG: hypothetical protein ACK5JH_12115 [Anaerocolumna sp.]